METKPGKEIKTIVIEDPADIKWYREWCLPYIENSKITYEAEKILIPRKQKLCNFLYLLKKFYKHPIYTDGFSMMDLFYIDNIDPEELEEEIKIELEPATDYDVRSEFRDSLKELYAEWKEALNNLHETYKLGPHTTSMQDQSNWVRLKINTSEFSDFEYKIVLKE